ncbi:MAG: hypothetical protein FJ038_04815 [Chloroflexi bacterium]|nr:hypothetical protein [Chloroflexota bacterium]
MIRALVALMLLTALTAEECTLGELGGVVNKPGAITVYNTSADQVAVIAILADDVKSYPTLGPNGSASVTTNVGGKYEVRVVMTPENAAAYRAELKSLRALVEKAVDGTADPAEKARLFVDLAGIQAAIRGLETQNAAGCSGKIKLSTEEAATVVASLAWLTTSGSGFWDVSCGSN